MPQYKLTYFNCKGLGEAIRFLFAYGNIAFEDNRIEESEWPALKTSKLVAIHKFVKSRLFDSHSSIKATQISAINGFSV